MSQLSSMARPSGFQIQPFSLALVLYSMFRNIGVCDLQEL